MIIPMKKLTLLCLAADQERALDKLRDLGVVHLKPFVPPAGSDVDAARAAVQRVQRVLDALPKASAGQEIPPGDASAMVDEVNRLLDARKQNQEARESVQAEINRVVAFGNFNPADIQKLSADGIYIKLYKAPIKNPPPRPEGVMAYELSQVKKEAYWALISREDFTWDGVEEQRLPTQSLDDLLARRQALSIALEENEKHVAAYASARQTILDQHTRLSASLSFVEARAGMGSQENIAYLQGFLPAADVEGITTAAAEEGWGFMIEDPGPMDDVPVKLKQPAWARPIQALFNGINILPAYNEADVSWVVMIFFSLFFAMIVGDTGYGAIFLGLTLAFRKKLPRAAVSLLVITSVCTIIWGIMNGSYFGISPDVVDRVGLGRFKVPFFTDDLRGTKNLMGFSFLLGAIQISIARLWNFIDLAREKNTKALEQFGWFMTTWFMFFLADRMVLGGNMMAYLGMNEAQTLVFWQGLYWVFGIGVALIILFMLKPSELKTEWINLALLFLNIINNFTDVVSYIRLYAVGTAGFAVANAFNNMIFGGETVPIWWALIGILILFAAHALNILLCIMGVMVHGIRLNTLEFSNHKGITWSGMPYRPFAKPKMVA